MFQFGVQFQLDSKTILQSASKLNANKLKTNLIANTLMNFDNLILNDLMTGLSVYPISFDFALLTLTEIIQ